MMNTTKQFQIYKRAEGTEHYNDKMSDKTLIQLADKFGTISFYDYSDEELEDIEEQAKKDGEEKIYFNADKKEHYLAEVESAYIPTADGEQLLIFTQSEEEWPLEFSFYFGEKYGVAVLEKDEYDWFVCPECGELINRKEIKESGDFDENDEAFIICSKCSGKAIEEVF